MGGPSIAGGAGALAQGRSDSVGRRGRRRTGTIRGPAISACDQNRQVRTRASRECTASRRITTMCALLHRREVITVCQRESSSKRPRPSSTASPDRSSRTACRRPDSTRHTRSADGCDYLTRSFHISGEQLPGTRTGGDRSTPLTQRWEQQTTLLRRSGVDPTRGDFLTASVRAPRSARRLRRDPCGCRG